MRPNFLRLAAVGVAVTAVLGTASVTAAADRSGGPKTTFTSETSAPTEVFGFVGGAPDPARCNPADGRCLLPYAGHDALDGDLVGALDSAGAVSMDLATGQGHAATLSLFRGTVAGCPGPGTALLRFTSVLGAEPGRNVGRWVAIDGTGTGGLAGLVGAGTFVADTHPDGTITATGEGHLRCRPPR